MTICPGDRSWSAALARWEEKSNFLYNDSVTNVLKAMAPVLADNKAKYFSSGELLYLSHQQQHF